MTTVRARRADRGDLPAVDYRRLRSGDGDHTSAEPSAGVYCGRRRGCAGRPSRQCRISAEAKAGETSAAAWLRDRRHSKAGDEWGNVAKGLGRAGSARTARKMAFDSTTRRRVADTSTGKLSAEAFDFAFDRTSRATSPGGNLQRRPASRLLLSHSGAIAIGCGRRPKRGLSGRGGSRAAPVASTFRLRPRPRPRFLRRGARGVRGFEVVFRTSWISDGEIHGLCERGRGSSSRSRCRAAVAGSCENG